MGQKMKWLVEKIISGGQSGVDRVSTAAEKEGKVLNYYHVC
jgi:hypothetical protein